VYYYQEFKSLCGKGQYTLGCFKKSRDKKFCHIYSYYDEDTARFKFDWDGESIYDHEHKHCKGWYHTERE